MRIVKRIAWSLAALGMFFTTHARAEDRAAAPNDSPPADVAPAEPAPGPRTIVLRANSLVALRLIDTLSSDVQVTGATFALEVDEDVIVDGVVVIPAESKVEGQVIHAAKSGMLGKAGELIVTSRFVMVGDRKVKLRSLLSGTGQSRAELAFVILPFIKGKKIIIPGGTELAAKVAQDETFIVPPAGG